MCQSRISASVLNLALSITAIPNPSYLRSFVFKNTMRSVYDKRTFTFAYHCLRFHFCGYRAGAWVKRDVAYWVDSQCVCIWSIYEYTLVLCPVPWELCDRSTFTEKLSGVCWSACFKDAVTINMKYVNLETTNWSLIECLKYLNKSSVEHNPCALDVDMEYKFCFKSLSIINTLPWPYTNDCVGEVSIQNVPLIARSFQHPWHMKLDLLLLLIH